MNTKRFLIIISVLAILLIVLYAYFFSSLSDIGEKHRTFAGDIKSADKILWEENHNRERLSSYFVKEGEQANFVSSLESRCFNLSLDCVTQSLNESTDDSGSIKILSMTLSAKGSFEGLIALISSLETSSYPIVISKSSLSSGGEVWGGVIDLSVPVLTNQ